MLTSPSPARPVAWQVNRFFRHATSSPATPYWADALRRLAHLTAGGKDSLGSAPSPPDGQSIKEHFFRVALGVPLAMCRHHTTPQSCRVAIDSKVRYALLEPTERSERSIHSHDSATNRAHALHRRPSSPSLPLPPDPSAPPPRCTT